MPQTLLRQTARILKAHTYAEVWALLLEGVGVLRPCKGRTANGLPVRANGMVAWVDLQDILFLVLAGRGGFRHLYGRVYRRSPHYRWLAEKCRPRCRWDGLWPSAAGRLLADELAVQHANGAGRAMPAG